MRAHLPAPDHCRTDPAPARCLIRINGHPGATVLSAAFERRCGVGRLLTGFPPGVRAADAQLAADGRGG
jgi:hypothetical protein